ncbi:MAG: hypothetical protein RIC35_06350 [Marinoscillum sp.]
MKNLTIVVVLVVNCLSLAAQNPKLTKEQDSMRRVMEERMKVWDQQRKLYDKMYAVDPKHAVDSTNASQKAKRLAEGLKRLKGYQQNTRIDTLNEINLSYAGLSEVPDFVFNARKMEVLILDWNDIKMLPKELSELDSLKRIYWRGNNLDQYWWIRIQKIKGLEKLDLSNNSLSRLPRAVRKLEGLEELVLDENFLGEIPVHRLARADFIKAVSFNKSHSMSLDQNDYHQLDFIEILKVNNSKIANVHESFYDMAGLKELQLQENQLKQIPEGISRMKRLEKLSFYKNELETLPEDLFDLNLKIIDLYYNQLEVIPDEIGTLIDLEVLFLANNKIYSLPESIGNLKNLEEMYVHHNRLSVLPESISKLAQLKVARVNDNYLIEFPAEFMGMKDLVDLDVSNNQLETLSPDLENLPSLELFNYQENPIDFNSAENAYLSPMIVRMLERGVTCVPRIYREEVSK